MMVFHVDEVIMAIGTTPNPLITSNQHGLNTTSQGCLVVNQVTNETSIPMVFAGGDVVTGSATVILAMEAGRQAAKAVIERFEG